MRRWDDHLPPILWEDGACLVVDKPAGLAVHGGPRTARSLEAWLALGARPIPRLVHRLDRDTSGCLLLAKRGGALTRLMAAFADGAVEKVYLAVVAPGPVAAAGVVEVPLGKVSSPRAGWRMVESPAGKPAVTAWRVVERGACGALVEFRPRTGRTHQLRVHARYLAPGAAIAGDRIYGGVPAPGLMLHAARIRFPDASGAWVEVIAPLPERFGRFGFGAGGAGGHADAEARPGRVPGARAG